MRRLAVTLSMFALLACGGTDTAQTSDSEAMPPVSTAGQAAPAPSIPEPAAAPSPAPEVASCLSLIGQKRFRDALPVCAAALDAEPDNVRVQEAVQLARSETAKLAAAEAAESASSEAAASVDEAAKSLPGQPGD